MPERTASCHCGKLQITCEGDPAIVMMCHCEDCQRRTGASYNLGAWFDRSRVTIKGEERTFTRAAESGREITFHFCPNCGSNLYWHVPAAPNNAIGIAVGCFADPAFPAPTVSYYGKNRHHWVTQPADLPSYIGNMTSELE